MTPRKPPGISFPGWIERQIQAAEADGAFDRLPGKGRPIAGLDEPQPELAWLAGYLKREDYPSGLADSAPRARPGG